jgi:hypothetical protein
MLGSQLDLLLIIPTQRQQKPDSFLRRCFFIARSMKCGPARLKVRLIKRETLFLPSFSQLTLGLQPVFEWVAAGAFALEVDVISAQGYLFLRWFCARRFDRWVKVGRRARRLFFASSCFRHCNLLPKSLLARGGAVGNSIDVSKPLRG